MESSLYSMGIMESESFKGPYYLIYGQNIKHDQWDRVRDDKQRMQIGPGVNHLNSLSLTVSLQLIPLVLSLPHQPAAEKPAWGGHGSITRT